MVCRQLGRELPHTGSSPEIYEANFDSRSTSPALGMGRGTHKGLLFFRPPDMVHFVR